MTDALRTPTLDDVAARAGVSSATVSRFLNTSAVVAPKTAERIREAIAATGYIPNLLAGGLASNKTRQVSVLIPNLADSIFNETIEAMVTELSAAGSVAMLGLIGTEQSRTDELIMGALGRRVDAIITTGTFSAENRQVLRRSKVPVIEIWDLPDDPVDIAIGFSHRAAGRDMARFLKTRGYLRPHLLTAKGGRARMRSDGFIAEWLAQGGDAPSESAVDLPSRFGHARAAFATIKRLPEMPDVVVCGSDWLALGLIIEAQASGLKVPGDLGVTGFGNSTIAGDMRPTLTTIDIDGARIAREAIGVLRSRAAGEVPIERRIDVGFRLIARDSA
jgi:LacI family gluconate utilization system Gnt-I transcriptional repressor